MSLFRAAAFGMALGFAMAPSGARAQDNNAASEFWAARDVEIAPAADLAPVRIGIWDSGVDLSLFVGRVALDADDQPLVRGYDAFKQRQDLPMAVLPPGFGERQDELNLALTAIDDLDNGVESPAATLITARLEGLTVVEATAFSDEVSRWSGYTHGTAVADIALAGHARAEIVVARMEWWRGSPPVPCWTRELADREAASIRDLLTFLVDSGARVVNMSWGRFEASYLGNLEECAPDMPINARRDLARYTVEKIRTEMMAGMAEAPHVLFVGAAGNASASLEAANPATRFSLPNFVLVGAVDRSGILADYTNTGPEVVIYANGDRVPARLPGGMLSFPSGTSMATPNVTNAAAKMLAVNPQLFGADLRTLLEQTADTNSTGQSLLHTARAVEAARAAASPRVEILR